MTAIRIDKFERASHILKALSHPVRMAMMEMLIKDKQLNVTTIYEQLGIEQAVASQHLAVLKKYGVLEVKKKGKNAYYYIRQPRLYKIIELINKCELC